MGYCYRGNKLVCDGCGGTGGVRKRTCPYKVTFRSRDGSTGSLPYCSPPALCSGCLKRLGGSVKIHAECAEGAARSQKEHDERARRLDMGEHEVRSAFGSWHDTVDTGWVGVVFSGNDGDRFAMVPDADYEPSTRRFLSDYPTTRPWPGPHHRFETDAA